MKKNQVNNEGNFPLDKAGERGFIREIVLIVVALIVVKYYFDVDVIAYGEEYFGKLVGWVKGWFD
ncbi:MAG TPA: hypothetical protein VJH67_03755 [Candidatus Paceibacterota bacterium]